MTASGESIQEAFSALPWRAVRSNPDLVLGAPTLHARERDVELARVDKQIAGLMEYRQMLIPSRHSVFGDVLRTMEVIYHIPREKLLSPRRFDEIATGRQIAMGLLAELGLTQVDIAEHFSASPGLGCRTRVAHAITRCRDWMSSYPSMLETYRTARAMLGIPADAEIAMRPALAQKRRAK